MSEWISCNRKNPGKSDVLVWVEFYSIGDSGHDIGKLFGDKWAFGEFSAEDYNKDEAEVTHWMPLPEPPK